MGRRAESKKEKELRGTLRSDRAQSEPVNAERITDVRRCTDVSGYAELSMRAKGIYRQKCKEIMEGAGLYREDLQQIIIYANTYDEYWQADECVKKHGIVLESMDKMGYPRLSSNPAVYIRNNAAKLIAQFAARFGFSPLDRQKLKMEEKDEQKDPLEEFMNQYNS